MQAKTLLLLATVTITNAQSTSLTDALGSQDSLSSLASLLANSSLSQSLDSLSNVTILAPNNDALSAVLNSADTSVSLSAPGYIDALLSYHILNGTYYTSNITNSSTFLPTHLANTTYTNITGGQVVEAARVNDNVTFFSALKLNSTVVTPDLNFTGGTVHIINSLLFIPGNITDTLIGSNLTAAAGALEAVNSLPSSLGNTQDITIFAPNNDAFNAIGTVASNLTTDQLSSILGYHVLNGTVAYSSDLSNSTVIAADGTNLTISVIDGTVFVNDARVTVPNILLENGVCHVIDQVLNPNNTDANPDPSQSSATPAFSGASSTTEIPFTSGVETATTTFPAATSATGGGTGETSSSEGLGVPIQTGAVGAAALFGGAAILVNL
ncbi:FAS1 domain-containing protein [Xylariaceae sp. FL1272]|nr:FAS1 domain-containing protein [Xylariaceae sp. FL1272]